ncbi:MAG: S8 family peptidase [Bacteroidales bacterium]|nr:S8 family peptidase [Candidatus Colimorpha pelethequi]
MNKKACFIAMALLFGLATNLSAQTKCGIDSKVSMQKALLEAKAKRNMEPMRIVAKVSPSFDSKKIQDKGILIGSRIGDIVTLTVPVERLSLLESDNTILQYQVARSMSPDCNKVRFDTKTDSVHAGLGLPQAFDGSGVLIGITDWGFDYTHPNFNNGSEDNHRILRAWDQFKLSGPAPEGFNYGTEFIGYDQLIEAQCDTFGLYGYATHASHVTGIAAGKGMANGDYQGQAPGANLIMASFGLNEACWLDAVAWMKAVAQQEQKRLVINSSWGMYTFSTLDGTSLLSQAIDAYSQEGIIFVTSGGNNGDATMHISRTFTTDHPDTIKTVASYYSDGIGQALICWGEEGKDFDAAIGIYMNDTLVVSPFWNTAASGYIDTFLVVGSDTIPYNVMWEHANPFNNRSHLLFNVTKVGNNQLRMFITAQEGTVHAWNINLMANGAGNVGCDFKKNNIPLYVNGDNSYGIGEPACAQSTIAIAAHNADRLSGVSQTYTPGNIAYFSSLGPTLDGRNKPEISAPGVSIISSISSFTSDSYPATAFTLYNGKRYIFSEMSGTSMSSPAATGIVALMLQANPNLSLEQIKDILFTTARNDVRTGEIHASGEMSDIWGWGKIDAMRAVNGAIDRLSIEEAVEKQQPLSIYPNPAYSQVTILTGTNQPTEVEIYSTDGKKVMTQTVTAEGVIDVSRLTHGIYVARVQDRTGVRTAKIVVQ